MWAVVGIGMDITPRHRVSINHKPQATGHTLLFSDSPDEAARAAEIRGPCWENSRNRLTIGRATTSHELHSRPPLRAVRTDTRVRPYGRLPQAGEEGERDTASVE